MEVQEDHGKKKQKIPKRPKDQVQGSIWDLQYGEDLKTREGGANQLLALGRDQTLKSKDQQRVLQAIEDLNPRAWLDLYKATKDLRIVADVARDFGGSEEGQKIKLSFGQALQLPNLDPMALGVARTLARYMPESRQFDQEVGLGLHPDPQTPKDIGGGETIVRPQQKNEVHGPDGQVKVRPSPGHDPRAMTIVAGSMEDFLLGSEDRRIGIGLAQSLQGGSILVKEVNNYMFEKMVALDRDRAMDLYQKGDKELTEAKLQSHLTDERRRAREAEQLRLQQMQNNPPQPQPIGPPPNQPPPPVPQQQNPPPQPQQGGWQRAQPKKDSDRGFGNL